MKKKIEVPIDQQELLESVTVKKGETNSFSWAWAWAWLVHQYITSKTICHRKIKKARVHTLPHLSRLVQQMDIHLFRDVYVCVCSLILGLCSCLWQALYGVGWVPLLTLFLLFITLKHPYIHNKYMNTHTHSDAFTQITTVLFIKLIFLIFIPGKSGRHWMHSLTLFCFACRWQTLISLMPALQMWIVFSKLNQFPINSLEVFSATNTSINSCWFEKMVIES